MKAVQAASYELGVKPYARNPNGLLVFVFEQKASGRSHEFIKKQTKASIFNQPAVVFSWTVDTQGKQIYTHDRLVNLVPPIFILESLVFPGKDYIHNFLKSYIPQKVKHGPDKTNLTLDVEVNTVSNFSPEALSQLELLFNRLVEEIIRKMPQSEYNNFPNATEVRIYRNVEQYIENQSVFDPGVTEALEDFKVIINNLQNQNPQASEQQAAEILNAEFREIRRREPQRWTKIFNLKRLWNGVKNGALKAGEHFTESTPWGKAGIGFLEGYSEDVD